MSTTHQNAKQVAVALERKGMLTIAPDENDQRIRRLVATKAGRRGWASRNRDDFTAVGSWFAGLTLKEQQELAALLTVLARHLSQDAGLSGKPERAPGIAPAGTA